MNEARGILLLGSSGLLGRSLVTALQRRRRGFVAPDEDELDLMRPGNVEHFLAGSAPAAVINAAAYTDVTRAEQPDQHGAVTRLNRDAPGELARACAAAGLPLAHVSTDYVFDGAKGQPYREEDPVAPLQLYGSSKLEGERAVLGAHPDALVVRTSTLFGPGRRARPHYVDAVLRQARERGRLELVRLPVSSPSYTPDLAAALLDLLDAGAAGIVHVVNRGACTRIELAREAMRLAGPEYDAEVIERPDAAGGPARPPYSVLDVGRLTKLTGVRPRTWQEALADYLESHPPGQAG
jgi:dTDP-4-dehydrorhamnose reductase